MLLVQSEVLIPDWDVFSRFWRVALKRYQYPKSKRILGTLCLDTSEAPKTKILTLTPHDVDAFACPELGPTVS